MHLLINGGPYFYFFMNPGMHVPHNRIKFASRYKADEAKSLIYIRVYDSRYQSKSDRCLITFQVTDELQAERVFAGGNRLHSRSG